MNRPLLVLASSSPYRREVLDKLQLRYDVFKPSIDETALPDEAPDSLVKRLATEKAQAVAQQRQFEKEALIIGSDQVAVCDGHILGKPHTESNAQQQLQQFVGKTVTFYTGLCVYNSKTQVADVIVVPFDVIFRDDLSAEEIRAYIKLEQPLNCAGSFKSEGLGISLFKALKGDDPNTLIGLPSIELLNMLRKQGINPLANDN